MYRDDPSPKPVATVHAVVVGCEQYAPYEWEATTYVLDLKPSTTVAELLRWMPYKDSIRITIQRESTKVDASPQWAGFDATKESIR